MPDSPETRNERQRRATRSAILEATADALGVHGFEALTVQRVVDLAEVARATFYLHFDDKEQAVWAVVHAHLEQLVTRVQDAGRSTSAVDRRARWLELTSHVREHRKLFELVIGERGPSRLHCALRRFMARAYLEGLDQRQHPALPPVPPGLQARFFSGALLGALEWWLGEGCEPRTEELADHLERLMSAQPPGEASPF